MGGGVVKNLSSNGKMVNWRNTVTGAIRLTFGVWLGLVSTSFTEVSLLAQEPSERNVAAGRRIYHQKADCQSCHGWAGDGVKMDNQAPDGANLRESQLNRDQLMFVIKCGLPGRDMPAFDRLSYSDDRCLGRTRADLRRMGLDLPDPSATLQNREVQRLVDFLLSKVVGQGDMDRDKCIDFWGEEVDLCDRLP